ncbi:related to alpha/beta hydrolase [Melanopsichium pennsylvanicum]|uniref:Related to alpha/beta hydrolase n=2 Tax=Melanopsichium pennsylvanicum TaxID=63383 RepID=A0AAJ4XQE3_9BASI|nr:related to alpha/beta hydrolase [Melanopsichium pennsylvanicum 4]SNX86605.1 related to alpha/beta hydrolase [Melanopsichium pennsylvanicum]
MATEALLPLGAAYTGATQSSLDAAKATAGSAYFPSVFNPETASKKGRAVVAKGRDSLTKNGSKDGFEVYYEVHGTGPTKVAFVMGLNNSCFGWLPQVEHLAKDPQYSCLVFDNRGVSNSETPVGWYSTSGMAEDAFDLLEHLGWIEDGVKRSVHVAGVSMGGMIGLEMARQRPEVLASLTLISTTPGRRFRTPTYGLTSLVRVLGGRTLGFDSEAYRLNRLITTLFPTPWLTQKSPKDPARTNQQVLFDMFKWRYAFTTRQSLHGAVSQMKAALTHNIPDADLERMDKSVPKICILTGDTDYLVDPRNSDYLKSKLTTAEFHQFDNAGHALGNQISEVVNEILEKVIGEGKKKAEEGA